DYKGFVGINRLPRRCHPPTPWRPGHPFIVSPRAASMPRITGECHLSSGSSEVSSVDLHAARRTKMPPVVLGDGSEPVCTSTSALHPRQLSAVSPSFRLCLLYRGEISHEFACASPRKIVCLASVRLFLRSGLGPNGGSRKARCLGESLQSPALGLRRGRPRKQRTLRHGRCAKRFHRRQGCQGHRLLRVARSNRAASF